MAATTPAQLLMLRTAMEHPDGTCLAAGFQRSLHAESTAKALLKQGLVRYLTRRFGYSVYQITEAGRSAAAKGGR